MTQQHYKEKLVVGSTTNEKEVEKKVKSKRKPLVEPHWAQQ